MGKGLRALALVWVVSIIQAGLAQAGFDDGAAAYRRGDFAVALEEWLPLADQGHPQAQYNVGYMHFNGIGVAKQPAVAMRWFRLAAEQGDAAAQMSLGLMYGTGQGVRRNFSEAYLWFTLAAAKLPYGNDRDQAVRNRDIISAKMSRAEITEALGRAHQWAPKGPKTDPVASAAAQTPAAAPPVQSPPEPPAMASTGRQQFAAALTAVDAIPSGQVTARALAPKPEPKGADAPPAADEPAASEPQQAAAPADAAAEPAPATEEPAATVEATAEATAEEATAQASEAVPAAAEAAMPPMPTADAKTVIQTAEDAAAPADAQTTVQVAENPAPSVAEPAVAQDAESPAAAADTPIVTEVAEAASPAADAETDPQAAADPAPAAEPEMTPPTPRLRPSVAAARPNEAAPEEHLNGTAVAALPRAASDGARYFIQLAAVRSMQSAKGEWSRLRARHADVLGSLDPVLHPVDLGSRGHFVRVHVGPFGDRSSAEEACRQLREREQDCLVVRSVEQS